MNDDDPRLTAYALGELDEHERLAIEAHFASDVTAREEAEELAAFTEMLRVQMKRETVPGLSAEQRSAIFAAAQSVPITSAPGFKRKSTARRILWPAAIAAALVLVATPLFTGSKNALQPRMALEKAAPVVSSPASPPLAKNTARRDSEPHAQSVMLYRLMDADATTAPAAQPPAMDYSAKEALSSDTRYRTAGRSISEEWTRPISLKLDSQWMLDRASSASIRLGSGIARTSLPVLPSAPRFMMTVDWSAAHRMKGGVARRSPKLKSDQAIILGSAAEFHVERTPVAETPALYADAAPSPVSAPVVQPPPSEASHASTPPAENRFSFAIPSAEAPDTSFDLDRGLDYTLLAYSDPQNAISKSEKALPMFRDESAAASDGDPASSEGRPEGAGFLSLRAPPVSSLPAGRADAAYASLVAALQAGSLPPPETVSVSELLSRFASPHALPAGADGASSSARVEIAQCPWDSTRRLVWSAQGAALPEGKPLGGEVEFNPARVEAYRLAPTSLSPMFVELKLATAGKKERELRDQVTQSDADGLRQNAGGFKPVSQSKSSQPVSRQAGTKAAAANDLLTVSTLTHTSSGEVRDQHPLSDTAVAFSEASKEMRWATAVYGFGLMLQDAPDRGSLTWDLVLQMAEGATGGDTDRIAFVELVKKAKSLAEEQAH